MGARRLSLLVPAFALAMLVGPAAIPAPASAASDPVDAYCQRAQALNRLGRPTEALAVTKSVAERYPDATRSCRAQAARAEQQVQDAQILMLWAAETRSRLRKSLALGQPDPDVLPPSTPGCPLRRSARTVLTPEQVAAASVRERITLATAAARACDRTVKRVVVPPSQIEGSATAQSELKTWAEGVASAWRKNVVDRVADLKDGALAVLLWLVLLLVLARLLLVSGGRFVPGLSSRLASLIVIAGALLMVWSADSLVLSGDLLTGPLIGAAAVALLAIGWAARPRLEIRPVGDAPDAKQIAAIRAIVMRLGSGGARGVEVPLGPDLDFLKDVGIVADSKNPVVAALSRLPALMYPPAPWQLTVSAATNDELILDLRRNRRPIRTEAIERRSLFAFLDDDAPAETRPSLEAFAAALAVVTMAQKHRLLGLAGASDWRSVAFQYLGSRLPREPEQQRTVYFARALELDAGNQMAQLSYWHSLYRHAVDEPDLRRFDDLLRVLSHDNVEAPLRFRALYNRLAIAANRHALAVRPGSTVSPGSIRRRCEVIFGLATKVAADIVKSKANPLAKRQLKEIEAALPTWTADLPRADEIPELFGPSQNYADACAHAVRDEVDAAVRRLALSDVDPDLRAARPTDPMLIGLVPTDEYRSEFGAGLPELLDLQPFATYAPALKATRLTSSGTVASTAPHVLVALGIPPDLGVQMRQRAACIEMLQQFDDAAVLVGDCLFGLGLLRLPVDTARRTALRARIVEAMAKHKPPAKPADFQAALDAWIPAP